MIYYNLFYSKGGDKEGDNREELLKQHGSDIKKFLPELREESRFKYLERREQQQLELLAKEVRDEEFLFKDEALSKAEIRDLERFLFIFIHYLFLGKKKFCD